MTSLASRRKHGFSSSPLHRQKDPHPVYFLSQRSSFWIATLSVMAFFIGNMMGQQGWHLFWASVLGSEGDSFIVYTGTALPIERVPDYGQWSAYGGNAEEHTFRQVPEALLVPLPAYDQSAQRRTRDASFSASVYSVGHAGSYATGAEDSGSHPGVDIRVPVGTPVLAMANGIVEEVKTGGGFGNVVVLRHPNVPDPARPSKTTTLYSAYAHLQSMLVSRGTVVEKGEVIAYSGDTGYASGPHLHFQVDREEAPFHPYWPFTEEEARRQGLNLAQAVDSGLFAERLKQYTVNPMLYAQGNYRPVAVVAGSPRRSAAPPRTLAPPAEREPPAADPPEEAVPPAILPTRPTVSREAAPAPRLSRAMRSAQQRDLRVQSRLSRQRFSSRQVSRAPTVLQTVSVAGENAGDVVQGPVTVAGVEIRHDGVYTGRGWETVSVQLVDAEGNPVANPMLERDIALRAAYGEAEFRPAMLTVLDFANGEAEVHMLPRGRRTIIIQAQPFFSMSAPMQYEQER